MMRLAAFSLALFALLPAPRAYAQFGLLNVENALSISETPLYPAPGDAVRLQAESSVFDLSQAQISWRAGGEAIGRGESAQVQAPGFGSETDVEADAMMPDGTLASVHIAIIPARLDLLIDSDSYVPPFYRGRALPAAGAHLVLQAIPRFKEPGGGYLDAADLVYAWKINGEARADLSGKGRFSAVIPAPPFFGTDDVSVEARSQDGAIGASATAAVATADPELALYEDHPLYGIRFGQALGATTLVPETEMAFAAITYFASAAPGNPDLAYEWRVNGAPVRAAAQSSNEITINAKNSSGSALVGLEVTSASNLFLDAKDSWNIAFPTDASIPGIGSSGDNRL